jgi:hypothetical protein
MMTKQLAIIPIYRPYIVVGHHESGRVRQQVDYPSLVHEAPLGGLGILESACFLQAQHEDRVEKIHWGRAWGRLSC